MKKALKFAFIGLAALALDLGGLVWFGTYHKEIISAVTSDPYYVAQFKYEKGCNAAFDRRSQPIK